MISPVLEDAVGVIPKVTLAAFPVTHLEEFGRRETKGGGRKGKGGTRRQLDSVQLSQAWLPVHQHMEIPQRLISNSGKESLRVSKGERIYLRLGLASEALLDHPRLALPCS